MLGNQTTNEMNGQEFNVGDRLVCIDVGNIYNLKKVRKLPPLRLNADYVVKGIYLCPQCGVQSVDVGLLSDSDGKLVCKCGTKTTTNGIHYCASARFVKRDLLHEEKLIKEVNKILEKQKV